jgi:hypothetical protein
MTSSSTFEEQSESSRRLAGQLARCSLAMARRFAGGSRLWCLAPDRADHALHIAVEFVHPVIVGKRALPATAILDTDPTAKLRGLVDPDDMIVCVGAGNHPILVDLAQRGPAWGVETFWIGWGPIPPAESSAVPLWLVDEDNAAVVRAYHLLWELTHVCFEQPDVLTQADEDTQASCKVCTDELTLAEVTAVDPNTAWVRTASGMSTVDTTLIDPVVVDELVLVSAGVALRSLTGGKP